MPRSSVKSMRRRVVFAGLVLALFAGGLTAWWLAPEHEPSAAFAPLDEPAAPAERPARPPAPRRPDLPPLPVPEDPDTGYAAAPDEPEEPAKFGVLRGTVVDVRGAPQARGVLVAEEPGCPRLEWRDGRFREPFFAAVACTYTAIRADGALPTRSPPVSVRVEPGADVEARWVLPAERTGGIGVWVAEHDDGIVVQGVLAGSPAWEAGLHEGDLIVEVDGTPTALLTAREFQAVMTGPEATEVRFVIAYEGDDGWEEEERVATRAFLDPQPNN